MTQEERFRLALVQIADGDCPSCGCEAFARSVLENQSQCPICGWTLDSDDYCDRCAEGASTQAAGEFPENHVLMTPLQRKVSKMIRRRHPQMFRIQLLAESNSGLTLGIDDVRQLHVEISDLKSDLLDAEEELRKASNRVTTPFTELDLAEACEELLAFCAQPDGEDEEDDRELLVHLARIRHLVNLLHHSDDCNCVECIDPRLG